MALDCGFSYAVPGDLGNRGAGFLGTGFVI